MLSAEQQKTIEESLWVVNKVLKDLGLQGNEDLRQEGNLWLCKFIANYKPERKTKWTTYAYKAVSRYIKTIQGRQAEKSYHFINFGDFATNADNLMVGATTLPITATTVQRVLDFCTPEEQQIVLLKCQGYKVYEISKIQGKNRSYIAEKLKEIRQKYYLKNS